MYVTALLLSVIEMKSEDITYLNYGLCLGLSLLSFVGKYIELPSSI